MRRIRRWLPLLLVGVPLLCYECHTVHPTTSVETRFLREQTVNPLCDSCHKEME